MPLKNIWLTLQTVVEFKIMWFNDSVLSHLICNTSVICLSEKSVWQSISHSLHLELATKVHQNPPTSPAKSFSMSAALVSFVAFGTRHSALRMSFVWRQIFLIVNLANGTMSYLEGQCDMQKDAFVNLPSFSYEKPMSLGTRPIIFKSAFWQFLKCKICVTFCQKFIHFGPIQI